MIEPHQVADRVRARAVELGFDLIGFGSADHFDRERDLILENLRRGHLAGMDWITPDRMTLACDPHALLPDARTVVALGTAYGGQRGHSQEDGRLVGRVARYARGQDYHDIIRPRVHRLAETIIELFGPATRCRAFVDTGPLVERAAAARAGLGFIGKNTCLLTGPHGSYVLLSAILTTAELPADPLIVKDCGSCRACLDACPTEAIVAPGQLDATRCVSYLTIENRGPIPTDLRPKIGQWVFGCDICQEVCPWNQARPGVERLGGLLQSVDDPFEPGEARPTTGVSSYLDLVDVLGLNDADFRARFRGTPLTRPKRAGLLRNAAVVLGNLRNPRAVSALIAALSDSEPLVRGHAAWALGQLDPLAAEAREGLESRLAIEGDEEVRRELIEALGGERGAS